MNQATKLTPQAGKVTVARSDPITPMQMLQIAVQQGADVDKIEKLMELERRWKADQAREAYYKAVSKFKKKKITVTKDKRNDQYASMYTTIGNLVNTVKGYASHERELFEEVTRLRSPWGKAHGPAQKVQAAQQLEGAFKLRLPNDASLFYFAFGETKYDFRPQVDKLASNGFLDAELVRASGTSPEDILQARRESWPGVKEARVTAGETMDMVRDAMDINYMAKY